VALDGSPFNASTSLPPCPTSQLDLQLAARNQEVCYTGVLEGHLTHEAAEGGVHFPKVHRGHMENAGCPVVAGDSQIPECKILWRTSDEDEEDGTRLSSSTCTDTGRQPQRISGNCGSRSSSERLLGHQSHLVAQLLRRTVQLFCFVECS
jgi:hypothetical protein